MQWVRKILPPKGQPALPPTVSPEGEAVQLWCLLQRFHVQGTLGEPQTKPRVREEFRLRHLRQDFCREEQSDAAHEKARSHCRQPAGRREPAATPSAAATPAVAPSPSFATECTGCCCHFLDVIRFSQNSCTCSFRILSFRLTNCSLQADSKLLIASHSSFDFVTANIAFT